MRRITIYIIFFVYCCQILGQEKVFITDFGDTKNTYANVLPALKRALEHCKKYPGKALVFPRGRYDFWPTECDGKKVNIGFDLEGIKNLVIDGDGSDFIFHGWMGVAQLDSCSEITFRNFSVDWDRPWISQAEIVNVTDNYLDVRIDKKEYPYVIENKRILFLGEGCKMPILDVYNNLYDKDKKEIVYNTWDSPLGDFFNYDTEELENGLVRFHAEVPIRPQTGTYISLFHAHYGISGIMMKNSKDLLFENLQVYHTVGNGFWALRCENITMNNASVIVNDKKGRVFSSVADASHFSTCKGIIRVENCAHTGQGDDFINVHGRSILISKVIDERTLEVKSIREPVYENDEYWFLNHVTGQRGEIGIVTSVTPIKENFYRVSFQNVIPRNIGTGDFIENKSWNPSLILRNCKILKRHRARGILVTTPKDVLIENNYFRTAGSAILIEGDMDFWLESGATNNVQIRNNVFEDCLTSGNAHGKRVQWGEAVITITPSHRPDGVKSKAYHKNIQITHNVFKTFDAPLLRARSVDGLIFNNNRVEKTNTYKPYTWQKSAFLLDGCRHVQIKDNDIDPNFTNRNILIENMIKSQVSFDRKSGYTINFVKGMNTYHTW